MLSGQVLIGFIEILFISYGEPLSLFEVKKIERSTVSSSLITQGLLLDDWRAVIFTNF